MVQAGDERQGREKWDAILVAAGRGERLGLGAPKGRIALHGEPLFLHSLRVLMEHPRRDQILLVAPPEPAEIDELRALAERSLGSELAGQIVVVAGGAERQDSVWAALQVLLEAETSMDRVLLIHDAARPLLSHSLIERCLHAMESDDAHSSQGELPGLTRSGPWGSGPAAVVPGLPVRDTLKLVFEDRVVLTHARENLFTAQTPQVFRLGPLLRAHRRARESGLRATDDAALLEWQGIPIRMVRGEIMNWKVTFPDDLDLVERLLAAGDDARSETG